MGSGTAVVRAALLIALRRAPRWLLWGLVVGLLVAPSAVAAAPVVTQVSGSPFSAGSGSNPESLAFSPSGGLVAAASQGAAGVSIFTVDQSTGALSLASGSPVSIAPGTQAKSVAFSPTGALLAVADSGSDTVSIFSVDQTTGAVAAVTDSPFSTGAGSAPSSVAFSPSGGVLAVADSGSDTVSIFSVDQTTGALAAATDSPFSTGAGSAPASLDFSPNGGLLAVADSGLGTVSVFSVDESTGALTLVGSPVAAGAGAAPVSVAFSPTGSLLATANEGGFATISTFTVNESTGAVSLVPGSPFASDEAQPVTVSFSVNGALLATADTADTNGSGMSVYDVNASSGALTVASGSPFYDPYLPFAAAFSPAGGLLATANADGNVSVFSGAPSGPSGPSGASVSLSVTTAGAGTDAPGAAGSVSSVPSGISCSRTGGADGQGTCSQSFPAGTTVSLAASPAIGSTFSGWGGACSGTGSCQVTLSSAEAVSATFTRSASQTQSGTPVNTARPVISGTTKAGRTLACSTGAWTNGPTGFTYQWYRDGIPIQGATASAYIVKAGDEQLTLTCSVTASNTKGAGLPATSAKTGSVSVPHVASCPAATGRLDGLRLGLVRLGMTRVQARHAYTKSSDRGKRYQDFFCLTPIGVRVGYASPKLLATVSKSERKSLAGRVIWASTASAYYTSNGIRVGAAIASAAKVLKLAGPIKIGINDWYLARERSSTVVLKVRRGLIEEVGIGDRALTAGAKAQRTFLESFS